MGTPLQLPPSTVSAWPILPAPSSAGAVRSTGAACDAVTVTLKLAVAVPPEFLAVTVTAAALRKLVAGMRTWPVAASTVAPAPVTLKASAAPAKAGAASTSTGPLPCTALTSASVPVAAGGAWVTVRAALVAVAVPAALPAVTRQASAARSSPGTGV